MSLRELRIENLRSIEFAELELHARLNAISGPNGSGKTSILEAIHLLGRGRSFRTRITERLVRRGSQHLFVIGRTGDTLLHNLGIGFDRDTGLEARIDRQPVESLAELSHVLPLQVIDPGIHLLVEEGPPLRRRWLDWGVFHVEPGFMRVWMAYTRALRQRNASLKSGLETGPWDIELARLGEALTRSRQELVEHVEPLWREVFHRLAGEIPVEWSFHRGWSQDRELLGSLQHALARDRERGSTSVGAHRFDVVLKIEGRNAREVVLRGQQKLLGVSMVLAMARLAMISGSDRVFTLLLDDPAAELDRERTQRLVDEIRTLQCQLVTTSLDPEGAQFGSPDRAFHVEHGRVRQL